jgi:lysophospholipase L1-like esterase
MSVRPDRPSITGALRRSALICAALVSGVMAQHAGEPGTPKPTLPTLFLIGDSTMKNGRGTGEGGLWGWGDLIGAHFNSNRVRVVNRALGGRSSRTYFAEGLWEKVLNELRPGDFVMMQFGHNDGGELFAATRPRASLKGNGDETREGVVEQTGKREVVHSYGWYLRKYIADAKGKGATPVVLSPVPRNIWKDGKVARAANDYGRWAAEAARAGDAAFVDLNDIIARRYEEFGEARVRAEFFTDKDHTHTTRAGAKVNAECVVAGVRGLTNSPLAALLAPASREE